MAENSASPEVEAPSIGRGLPRLLVPLAVALVASAVPFLIMCSEYRFRATVPIGFAAFTIAAWGILDAVGTFDRAEAPSPDAVTLRSLAPHLGLLAGSIGVHILVLTLAVAGVLPKPILTSAILVPLTLFGVVVATFRAGAALGAFKEEDGTRLALGQRHGFWLVVLNIVLFVPLLGSYSLSDPWETHYGEVAREMLARDDWISLWWAQDGYFWSKPILDFWAQGLSFSLLGVKYMPDQMLIGAARGLFPQPEWAARMPVFLMTLAGTYALYRAVARVFGRRAGFIAGLVLTTMPYWYLIAHQTMTDMPYVGTLTAAMALLLLGIVTDPEKQLTVYELRVGKRTFRLTAMHVVWTVVILAALPQVLYLVSRNVSLLWRPGAHGFRFHADEFFAGSGGGNCGLPGNQACSPDHPVLGEFFGTKEKRGIQVGPIHLAAVWAVITGLFLWLTRKESRLARTYFLGAWYFLALSAMAKGAPGLVLPIASALGFIGVTRRWQDLRRMELVGMVLIALCVGAPWYVQMFLRHGPPFIDRLIMHDMYKRAFVHVHDTNTGDDTSFRYYIWQLGYGLFPWTGLAAGGLLFWLRRTDRTKDVQGDAASFLFVWFIAAFGMFTITLTKFHHYILPLVPPIAVFTGLVVNRLLGDGSPAKPGTLARYLTALTAGSLLVLYGIMRFFPRRFMGTVLTGAPSSRVWGALIVVLGLAGIGFAVARFGRRQGEAEPGDAAEQRYESGMLGALGVASAVVAGLSGRDMMSTMSIGPNGSARMMQLFTYNYGRPWPDSLDFTPAYVAFTVVAVVLCIALGFSKIRRHVAVLLCVTGALWTAWGLDVYLFQSSPHWGQRETILAYYKDRTSPDEPLVAYQMNWKGENFYTGNKVPAFVSSGERFKEWLNEQKGKGVRRMYFTTEHGRVGTLKRELGDPPKFTILTDKAVNNKFFMARVEF